MYHWLRRGRSVRTFWQIVVLDDARSPSHVLDAYPAWKVGAIRLSSARPAYLIFPHPLAAGYSADQPI